MSYLSIISALIFMLLSSATLADVSPLSPQRLGERDLTVRLALIREGGMSGGGGESLKPGGDVDTYQILKRLRTELVLFFKAQSRNPSSALLERAVNPSKNIVEIILATPIYESFSKCRDSAGNPVDGSIHSPHPGSICIHSSFLKQFTPEEARKQGLALAAHEYSHLLGFSEAEATALQQDVYHALTGSSRDSSELVLREAEQHFAMARGAIRNYREVIGNGNWTRRCGLAKKLDSYLWKARSSSEYFSVFDTDENKTFLSYRLKIRLLVESTCRWDENEELKALYAEATAVHFRNKKQIYVSSISSLFFEEAVDPTVVANSVDSAQDFDRELEQVRQYLDRMYVSTWELSRLRSKEKFPLR